MKTSLGEHYTSRLMHKKSWSTIKITSLAVGSFPQSAPRNKHPFLPCLSHTRACTHTCRGTDPPCQSPHGRHPSQAALLCLVELTTEEETKPNRHSVFQWKKLCSIGHFNSKTQICKAFPHNKKTKGDSCRPNCHSQKISLTASYSLPKPFSTFLNIAILMR